MSEMREDFYMWIVILGLILFGVLAVCVPISLRMLNERHYIDCGYIQVQNIGTTGVHWIKQ